MTKKYVSRRATGAGDTDGMVDELLGRGGDARGAFIKRPELSEADWKAYEKAFYRAYKQSKKARPR